MRIKWNDTGKIGEYAECDALRAVRRRLAVRVDENVLTVEEDMIINGNPEAPEPKGVFDADNDPTDN